MTTTNKNVLTKGGLNEKEAATFLCIRRAHIRALGTAEKEKHAVTEIKSIKKNAKSRSFDVRYSYGELVRYYLDGTLG